MVLLAALLAAGPLRAQTPEPSRWWSEVDRVDGFLREGRWKTGAREGGKLRAELMRVSWRGPDLGQVLSELAFLAAVADANLGEEDAALWEWSVAQAHERVAGPARGGPKLAERDLAPYGKAADLLPAHPLRARGEVPAGVEPPEHALFTELEGPAPPPYEPTGLRNVNVERERLTPVTFEVYVDPEGRIHQPVIASSWAPPVVLQWGFDNLRLMPPFTPARLRGEPVGALQDVEPPSARRRAGSRAGAATAGGCRPASWCCAALTSDTYRRPPRPHGPRAKIYPVRSLSKRCGPRTPAPKRS